MKQAYYSILYIYVISIIVSCSQPKQDKEIIPEQLSSSIFISGENIKTPMSMTSTDSNLIVINTNQSDLLVDVFDYLGNLEYSFLKRGDGPNEALRISCIQYYSDNNNLYAIDSFNNKIFIIAKSNGNQFQVISSIPLYSEQNQNAIDVSKEIAFTGVFGKLSNDILIISNGTTAGMLALTNSNGELIKTLEPYPNKDIVDKRLTDWANIQLYYPQIKVSPNGKFAVVTYTDADIRFFIETENDSIHYSIFEDAYPNDIYIVESGNNFVQGSLTSKSYTYTQDLSLSNDYAYQLYIGMTLQEITDLESFKDTHHTASDNIRVFDKNGALKRVLKLDKWVQAIAVTPDDKYLYALAESSDDGYYILKYEL